MTKYSLSWTLRGSKCVPRTVLAQCNKDFKNAIYSDKRARDDWSKYHLFSFISILFDPHYCNACLEKETQRVFIVIYIKYNHLMKHCYFSHTCTCTCICEKRSFRRVCASAESSLLVHIK